MLLYLSGHTCIEISLAVNICDWYMFSTKRSHELVLNGSERYLKQTNDCGLVLNTYSDVCKFYVCPDADSSVMFGHGGPTDPACVNSRTGFIITFTDFPVFWVSNLQTMTYLSTMEAEIIAMDHCCR